MSKASREAQWWFQDGRSLSENSRPGPQKTRRRLSFRCAKHKDTVSAVDIIEFWLHLPIEMSWNVFELKHLRPKRNIGMSPHHQRADLRSWNWEGRVLCCAVSTAIHSLSCQGEVTQKMPSQAKHKLLLWSECHVNYLSARVCRRRSTPQCHHSCESNQDIHLWDFLRLHNLLRHNIFSQLVLKPSLVNFSIKQVQILARVWQAIAGQASAQWLRCFLLFETSLKQYLIRDLDHSDLILNDLESLLLHWKFQHHDLLIS